MSFCHEVFNVARIYFKHTLFLNILLKFQKNVLLLSPTASVWQQFNNKTYFPTVRIDLQ